MSREDAKKNLIALGVAEPTEEAITNYLNTLQSATKSAEDRANRYKADADRVKELTKQIEEMNNEKLSDVEKANKATEDAMKEIAKLQQTVKQMELSKSLAEIGIVGDDATSLVGEDGALDVAKLGEILTAREKNAVAVYQKQALDNTPSPNGGKDEEPDAPYKDIVDRVVASKKTETDATDIVNAYL